MIALFLARIVVNRTGRFGACNTEPTLTTNDQGRIEMAKRSIRKIRIEGNKAFIPLTQGKEAIIDAKDVPLVEGYNWCAVQFLRSPTYYACRKAKREDGVSRFNLFLHRAIMNAPDGLEVDHKNRDGLDNRRRNLRLATRSQNQCNAGISSRNSTGFKGVRWHIRDKKWYAVIKKDGRLIFLGYHRSVRKAHAAYCEASKRYHGEFGSTE